MWYLGGKYLLSYICVDMVLIIHLKFIISYYLGTNFFIHTIMYPLPDPNVKGGLYTYNLH